MNTIARTILEQIGGKRFAVMTGSRDFVDMGNRRTKLEQRQNPALTMPCKEEEGEEGRIKDEVKQIVKDELERIASDESLKHLLQNK